MKLIDLILSGKIKPETKIIRKTKTDNFIGWILHDGTIKLEDNSIHRTLSGAAKHTNNGRNIDGWLVWRIYEQQDICLNDLRK